MKLLRADVFWRTLSLLLPAAIFYIRFDLPSPLVGGVVWAWVVGAVTRRNLNGGDGTEVRRWIVFGGALATAWVLPVGFLWIWRIFSPGPLVDGYILMAPYHLIPAIAWGAAAGLLEVLPKRGTARGILYPLLPVGIILLLFSTDHDFVSEVLAHPLWYVLFAATFLAVLIPTRFYEEINEEERGERVCRSGNPERGMSTTRRLGKRFPPVLMVLLILLLLIQIPLLTLLQRGSVTHGGGLIQSTMFRFDFSEIIQLESEISMGNDLVLLYHEERPPDDRLLRRFVLAEYDERKGFYYRDLPDDREILQNYSHREPVHQGYYLVNFDPDASIVVNDPVETRRLRNWDASSFNAVWEVESLALDGGDKALMTLPWPSLEEQSSEWRRLYTSFDGDERIAKLAEEITKEVDGYYATVATLQRYLQEGYAYSLYPGVASDGDQLGHFLFESHKGYCSYFAFSMALMARSLGIPARVAAGFFIDPSSNMLHYYPIHSNMAHAWVEIYFDDLGWVEFDPTSRNLAEGEDFTLDTGTDPRRLSALVEEILRNRNDLAVEKTADDAPMATFGEMGRRLRRRLVWILPAVLLLFLFLDYFPFVLRKTGTPEKRVQFVFRRFVRRLDRCGHRRTPGETWLDFAVRSPEQVRRELVQGVELYRKSLFSSSLSTVDCERFEEIIGKTGKRFREISVSCRIFWYLPGLSVPRWTAWVSVLLFLLLPAALPISAQEEPGWTIPTLEDAIWTAIDAENYERALELLERAEEEYPGEPAFLLISGDLFFDRELYSLAEEYYRKALAAGAEEFRTRYDLAQTLARLNRDDEAIVELEYLLHVYEIDRDVVADLGWLYFKVHRLDEAIALISTSMEDLGRDRYLSMTLGTVYSSAWDQENARAQYEWSIRDAREEGDMIFVAVGEYNLSILEAVFYRYADAFNAAQRSVDASDRSGGYLVRGELYEQQENYRAALADYERGNVLDGETPLAKLNMVALLFDTGYLAEAKAIVDDLAAETSRSWLYKYGTDLDRYSSRLSGYRADIYKTQSRYTWIHGRHPVRSLWYGIRAWYYRGVERRSALRTAEAYRRQGQELNAQWTMVELIWERSVLGSPYLERSRELETSIVPAARYDYDLITGEMYGDAALLLAAFNGFDPIWEAAGRTEALEALLDLPRVKRVDRERFDSYARQVYLRNPGVFTRSGIRLPVELDVVGGTRREIRRGRRAAVGNGLSVRSDAPFVLSIYPGSGEWSLTDELSGVVLRSGTVQGSVEEMVAEVARGITRYDLPLNDITGER